MSILVICPGCRKRYTVSDQFAGKTGPCPNCKTPIKIPKKSEEVVIHAPQEFERGGRGVTGKLVFRPIRRREVKVTPITVLGVCGFALVTLIAAWVMGRAEVLVDNLVLSTVALLLVSFPLAAGGYWFLHHDEELAPYRGRELYLRSAVCAVVYVALWGAYGFVAHRYLPGAMEFFTFVTLFLFVIPGALAAHACFDLEPESAALHYCFYALIIIVLRWLAGFDWVWNIPEPPFPPLG